MLLVLLTMYACNADCTKYTDFTDRWFQLESSIFTVDECYMFASNGDIVIKNENAAWPAGTWDIDDSGECVQTIVSGDDSISLEGYTDGCWNLIYNEEYALDACPCVY